MNLQAIEEAIKGYFRALDAPLEELSHGKEGKLADLPAWALTRRRIGVGVTSDGRGIVFKATPDAQLGDDSVRTTILESHKDVQELLAPWEPSLDLGQLSRSPFVVFGGAIVFQVNNLLAAPELEDPSLVGFGRVNGALAFFSEMRAKSQAIDLWNKALSGLSKSRSFIQEARSAFEKFRAIVRRKTFQERRIHRFIHDHARLLLPPSCATITSMNSAWGVKRGVLVSSLSENRGWRPW